MTERRDAAVIAHRCSLGGAGKFHAVNVPLHDGIDDATYFRIFEPIMREARRMRQAATCSASRAASNVPGVRDAVCRTPYGGQVAVHDPTGRDRGGTVGYSTAVR